MTKSYNHIDWNQITDFLGSSASSDLAKNQLALIQPKTSIQEAYESFESIANAYDLLVINGSRPSLESLDLFLPILGRLQKNAQLSTTELVYTRNFFTDLFTVGRNLAEVQTPWSEGLSGQLVDPRPILSYIDRLIGTEGEIKTDASETLYKSFHEKRDLKNGIHTLLEKLVKQHELEPVLQDKFVATREGRWVLPVKNGMQGKFPGIIHDTSQSKQTVFMEPQEVVKNNNRIKELDSLIQKEIARLLREISEFLYKQHRDIEDSFEELVKLDVLLAKASLKKSIGGSFVRFDSEKLELYDLSNPILELTKQSTDTVVKNDIYLKNDKKVLILSGPNAGGKTIFLKSVGLSAQLARCGLPISASGESLMPFYKDIFVSVGDSQNIIEGLSTFAGHMKELGEAASYCKEDSLVLVDEICGSTDPEEGAALAKAFIEKYQQKNSFAVITSHLGALKEDWREELKIAHASMEFDDENGAPVYKLIMGVSGSSYALKTAMRIGIDKSIVDAAIEHLSPESRERQEKLNDIDALKDQLIKSQKELEFEKRNAREQKQKYQSLIEKFKLEKDKKLDQSIKAAEKRIDDELLKARDQKKVSVFDIKAELPKIVKNKEISDIKTASEFAVKFPPGTMVFARNIQKNALVQSEPNNKGEVDILANSMKLSVPWNFLEAAPESSAKFKTSRLVTPIRTDTESSSDSLDLRGQTAEEALEKIDQFCDDALMSGLEKVKIIHGHGTGVLKKSVRKHLARARYSERWQSGGKHDGGDGVTWAYLK